ncbi:MAG: hypothetical protein MUC60_08905 [Oscillatoria sp. Prado101]|nr:hypothetical protein [Oscillatoria sp. Prado101]
MKPIVEIASPLPPAQAGVNARYAHRYAAGDRGPLPAWISPRRQLVNTC